MPQPLARPQRDKPGVAVLLGVGFVLAALGSAAAWMLTRGGGEYSHTAPVCSASTSVTCVASWQRTDKGVRVVFNRPAGRELEYKIGERTDQILVGNWFCGASETLALYRPATGVVYYFSEWPTDPNPVLGRGLADNTRQTFATVKVGDRNQDGCADLQLTAFGAATWFLPGVQRGRLTEVELPLGFESGEATLDTNSAVDSAPDSTA
jgi:hypothetical protein